ncbi:oligoribonuclease domain protein [Cooperia oncophora]
MLSAVSRRMSQVAALAQRLVWIDCEMTGLDLRKTDVVAEGPDIVIHQPESVLRNMEEWPRETFTQNGLLKKIRESTISLREAEDMVRH